MQRLTQTRPDNCWQTCVAMLLERPAELLPDQHAFAAREHYAHALRVYLCKHHGLTYLEGVPDKFPAVLAQRAFHLLLGETVRTTSDNDVWHALVGVAGEPYWDVHPSRAGLTKVCGWGVLSAISETWRDDWRRREEANEQDMLCVCTACSASRNTSVRTFPPIEIGERTCSEILTT